MENMIGEKRSGANGSKVKLGFVKPEFQQGYEIPLLPYQKSGIRSRELWSSRDQIIRIIPGYDPETGEIYRQNIKCNEYAIDADYTDYLSNTFGINTVMTNFCGGKALIADYAPGSPEDVKYGRNTVLKCFSNTIFNSLKTERGGREVRCQGIPEWRQWMGKQGKFSLPRTAFMMQALMFKVNGEYMKKPDANWEDREDPSYLVDEAGAPLPLLGVVALAQKESTKNLLQALVEPKDNSLPLDAITNNKYGGMAEADGNLLYLNSCTNADGTRSYLRPSVQEAAKGWSMSPFPLSPEQIKALWIPWRKLINFMTPEDQMQVLATEFGADTVNYVIGLDARFRDLRIPENIASAGFGRYAQFAGNAQLNSAHEPITVSTVADPRDQIPYGTPSPATSKPTGLGMGGLGMPKSAASAPSPARTQPTRNPMAPAMPSGLAAAKPVDAAAIQQELARMKASGVTQQENDTAALAQDILNDPDVASELPADIEAQA